MSDHTMLPAERRVTAALGSLFFLRMFGFFLILPIFPLYTGQLPGATSLTIGLAIGIYGLTQGLLQIPFGFLSDKYGRKPIIAVGLVLFLLGSLIAGMAHSIVGIIVGRACQGGAAIGSTIMATVADTTRETVRTKAMAMIGTSIGFAFALAMVIGPIMNLTLGLAGCFYLMAVLAVIGLFVLYFLLPLGNNITKSKIGEESVLEEKSVEVNSLKSISTKQNLSKSESLKETTFRSASTKNSLLETNTAYLRSGLMHSLKNKDLLKLNLGIFSLHAILTALFLVLPIQMKTSFHFTSASQSLLYFGVLCVAFILFIPLIIVTEKKQLFKQGLTLGILILLLSLFGTSIITTHILLLALSLVFFFTAFSYLEAILPSWASRLAPPLYKGTTMAIFSSAQFLGIFFGGLLGGYFHNHVGPFAVYSLCFTFAIIWLCFSYTINPNPNPSPHLNS